MSATKKLVAVTMLAYAGTIVPVVLAVVYSHAALESPEEWGLLQSFCRYDGQHYRHIAERGYSYNPNDRSEVAFFPVYPLAVRVVSHSSVMTTTLSQVTVANLCLLAAIILFALYALTREQSRRAAEFGVVALSVWPTAFFMRMGYSESLFLLVILAVCTGMARNWRPVWLVLLAGLATAVRPVGVALVPPLAIYLWQRGESQRQRIATLLWLPVACWGLLAYMVFQFVEFGDALAFAKTQTYWRKAKPIGEIDKAVALLLYEPVWSVYVPSMPGYWRNQTEPDNALLNLAFANPLYFVGAAGLIAVGAWKRWLSGYEVLLSVGLLGIPYVTRAYEMCMASHGRFAAVVFPAYIVLGHLLARLPRVAAIAILAISAFLMFVYAAQFGAGYGLI